MILEALRSGLSISSAATAAGIGRTAIYAWRNDDESFAADWDDALESGADRLEDELLRRAMEGTDKPVFQRGELVGYIREYSDTSLIFALKARRPEKYRERYDHKVDATLTGGVLVAPTATDMETWQAQAQQHWMT